MRSCIYLGVHYASIHEDDMSTGQWRVFGLLLLLLFMEVLRDKNVGNFFTTLAFNPFRQATQ